MVPGLPLLMLIVLSFGVMFGVVKPKRIGTFLLWLIVGPVLFGFIIQASKQVFWTLSTWGQVLSILLAGLILAAILIRFALPKGMSEVLAGHLIYDFLKWAVMLPLRVLALMIRSIVRTVGARYR